MDMRPDGGISYYRSLSCQMKIGRPLDQRARLSRFSNRLPILTSEMDYLKRRPDASAKLQHVNEALMQYPQDMKVYRKTMQHKGRENAAKEKEAQEKATKEKEFQEMAAKQKEAEERTAKDKETEEAAEEDRNSPATTISKLLETDFAHIKDNEANGVFFVVSDKVYTQSVVPRCSVWVSCKSGCGRQKIWCCNN